MTIREDEWVAWTKSKSSGIGDCVEARPNNELIEVRDSKDPDSPILRFTYSEWVAFLNGVRSGEFDLPADRPTH